MFGIELLLRSCTMKYVNNICTNNVWAKLLHQGSTCWSSYKNILQLRFLFMFLTHVKETSLLHTTILFHLQVAHIKLFHWRSSWIITYWMVIYGQKTRCSLHIWRDIKAGWCTCELETKASHLSLHDACIYFSRGLHYGKKISWTVEPWFLWNHLPDCSTRSWSSSYGICFKWWAGTQSIYTWYLALQLIIHYWCMAQNFFWSNCIISCTIQNDSVILCILPTSLNDNHRFCFDL